MLKLLGLNVADSPSRPVWIERREDGNNSPIATQGHITLTPEILLDSLFPLTYRVLSMPHIVISPLHIFSHRRPLQFSPSLDDRQKMSPSSASEYRACVDMVTLPIPLESLLNRSANTTRIPA